MLKRGCFGALKAESGLLSMACLGRGLPLSSPRVSAAPCSRLRSLFLPLCSQKSSFLPSYIIDVRELDEKLLNIIDMQFLYGYYEPTLLILYEPNQTWPGYVRSTFSRCPSALPRPSCASERRPSALQQGVGVEIR